MSDIKDYVAQLRVVRMEALIERMKAWNIEKDKVEDLLLICEDLNDQINRFNSIHMCDGPVWIVRENCFVRIFDMKSASMYSDRVDAIRCGGISFCVCDSFGNCMYSRGIHHPMYYFDVAPIEELE